MAGYFEPFEKLDEKTREITKAINSLMEELEAVDYYNQRVDDSKDKALADVMAHNRDEEIEHACMIFEWLRRNMDVWDENMKKYLFTTGSLLEIEENAGSGNSGGSLGIGKADR